MQKMCAIILKFIFKENHEISWNFYHFALKLANYNQFKILADFSFQIAHFQKNNSNHFLEISFSNFVVPWGHVRSHTKFGLPF